MRPERRLSGRNGRGGDQPPALNSHSGATALNPGVAGAEPPLLSVRSRWQLIDASAILELGGRKIAESRVQPLLVVDAFQEFADAGVGVGEDRGIRCGKPLRTSVFS